MTIKRLFQGLRNPLRKHSNVPILTVKRAWNLTPNMIRVTLTGDALADFPSGREGANCKLLIPDGNESRESFATRLSEGPAPTRRTYTVRHYRAESRELDIDFVAHGDTGPAAGWALRAQQGAFIGFMGPSKPKISSFDADWYFVAADPSAIPVAAATLEAMPRDAKGLAILEVPSREDQQAIDTPSGVQMHWLVQPTPHEPSTQQVEFLQSIDIPRCRIKTCIAGESGIVKKIRTLLRETAAIRKRDMYASGYWKRGLVEDEHQREKRAQSTAAA
ncbi:MAG: siderophore-interacting protein [Pseudomonadota bacterium]